MPSVAIKDLAVRLGVAGSTCWRWARRGRFGEPIDRDASTWRFADDEMLALNVGILRKTGATPARVWDTNHKNAHLKRLIEIANGKADADAEDRELAATLLAVAARQHARRAKGLRSPATTSAWLVAPMMLTKKKAGDSDMPGMLLGTASKLSPIIPVESGQPEN